MEPIRTASIFPLADSTQVPMARRAVHEAGRRLSLDSDAIARAEIVAVELANNILQHGRTVTEHAGMPTRRIQRPGEFFVSSTLSGAGLQMVAVDSGRGIPSLTRALTDGFSTAGTPGLGLGAVKRLSRSFDVYSALAPEVARGTVVSSIVSSLANLPPWDLNVAVISTALSGETVSGDSWATFESPGSMLFLMVDGLGHGTYANEAANVAVQLFLRFAQSRKPGETLSPLDLISRIHPNMHATRGAAIAIARVDTIKRQVVFCGVGNISGVLSSPVGENRSMISHNGTLGHQMPRVQEFQHSYTPGTLFIMHSDGIHTSWKLENAPGLNRQAPATIAGAIYRDAWRSRDDATVMVARLV